jgi:N-6 DNA Methylase
LRAASNQALDYYDWLPESQRPRYILTCDFQRWQLVDLDSGQEWRFVLADLKDHVEAFAFILGVQPRLHRQQSPANVKASKLMGQLHEALAATEYGGHDLEVLLVRLLFILFADDTRIFNNKDMFFDLIERHTAADGSDTGRWLGDLFEVLNTPGDKRQSTLDADLADFPYINGRLFEERIRPVAFTNVMRGILLDACEFDWGDVSPAIFGGLFESVIDKVTRRKQGAHYTPEDAILRLIGPLFLDVLQAELARAKALRSGKDEALGRLHDRLAALTFLDPACGAGNFLVVAYRELRELERELIKERYARMGRGGEADPAKLTRLNVNQFFGIEIDEFPAKIAEVALWMTDHIANTRLGEDFGKSYARIPLVTAPGIRHGDALEIEWETVLPAQRCSYVLGNPPFVGQSFQSPGQRDQMRSVMLRHGKSAGSLDYVAAWFIKAGEYLQSGEARAAFVSTNSITQGEQVAQLWPILFHRLRLEIAFAHRTFAWLGRAAVHCVIVGLARAGEEPNDKRLFSYLGGKGTPVESSHTALTAYLFDSCDADRHLVVKEQRTHLSNDVPTMRMGSKIVDGGHYIFDANQRVQFLLVEPEAAELLVPLIGSKEYIQGSTRWILDLQDVAPNVLRQLTYVRERISRVRAYREASKKPKTRELASSPLRFEVNTRPTSRFLVVPKVSSERREYVPIGWIDNHSVPSDLIQIVADASLWHFGILTSAMHMA